MLRSVRRLAANAIGAWVSRERRRERMLIAVGRAARRRSRLLGTLYWYSVQALVSRLRTTGNVYRRMEVGGVPLSLDVTDHTGLEEYFYGTAFRYEPGLTAELQTRLREGDVFIDIGANAGFFSLIGAKAVGRTGRVIAFEPHPLARAALVRLLLENGVNDRVDVNAAAVSDFAGDATLHVTAADTVLSTLTPEAAPLRGDFPFEGTLVVPATTMDRWAEGRPDLASRLAAVKIDVEGGEERVVGGMENLLARLPHLLVVCETSPGSGADRRLRALGMKARLIDDRGNAFGNYAYERVTP